MSTSSPIPIVERPAFFSGQRLVPADLSAAVNSARELRWLHNRALHVAGIALGLEVRAAPDGRRIEVSAGLALDTRGRELILAEPKPLDVPNVKAEKHFRLVIRHLDDERIASTERSGACGRAGAVRRREGAEVVFVEKAGDEDVELAAVVVQGCALATVPDLSPRRSAAAACEPYVAAGSTDPATTTWRPFVPGGMTVGVETTIDAATAGFGSTPSYQVQLLGSHDWPSSAAPTASVVGAISIRDASPVGFTAQIRVAIAAIAGTPPSIEDVTKRLGAGEDDLAWRVAWIGVEG